MKGDRVSCIFLLQFSPSFMLLDISRHMTYKQHWRKVRLSSISTDVDLMSFSVITNSNLPAKEGSRGWLGDRGSVSLLHLSGSMPSSFTWHFMTHSKKLIKKKRVYSIWTKVNLCFLVLSFFAFDGQILFSY